MSVFEHRSYDDHEHVAFCHDRETGLNAIIAIHNTCLGNAMGGCRMVNYRSADEALNDVLRLSRGMTYKSAAANLPLGGGKSVILGDPREHKTKDMLRAMGRFVDSLNGRYVVAEDSGMGEADMRVMAEQTPHVVGYAKHDGERGDPAPATAYGVFLGLRTAVAHRYKTSDIRDMRVAIQGMGNVGYRLAKLLHEAGAQLLVSDIFRDNTDRARREFGATVVPPEQIFNQDVEVISPCALGAVIDDRVLNQLRAGVIAGSANNQLAYDDIGNALKAKSILYAPDYVINAGGIIDVYYQTRGLPYAQAQRHMTKCISSTLTEVFRRAASSDQSTNVIADQVARSRFDPDYHPINDAA
ncbi:Glu/Leu/Phe/Val dehydrogenase [Pseudomaricurvus alkylphenolicus]|uniref:Glu/Leu/Phe/Val family dehydrogenase n=1 Tax=Pseudomaricurvus alkylphenolicus TaxID=1306991 RepID=UPI00142383CC|nr:Glu/Leu/Phe/Val dehydrogenase [Pseudomaricurvus alkylphenolicus]NIB39651.1 Glu/Leu/Phe/Val dehydrogenase [Pseudomaricurvus alkylphenolicus]